MRMLVVDGLLTKRGAEALLLSGIPSRVPPTRTVTVSGHLTVAAMVNPPEIMGGEKGQTPTCLRAKQPIEPSATRALLAGEAELRLPGTVGVDDLPIAPCDVLGIKGGARNDLSGDRQCRHTDAIRLQVGSEHGGGRSERCFPE